MRPGDTRLEPRCINALTFGAIFCNRFSLFHFLLFHFLLFHFLLFTFSLFHFFTFSLFHFLLIHVFNELLGNEDIKTVLRRMIRNGRVPRSLLLTGPEGSGKRQFAFELARAIVCTSPLDGEGCGRCAACARTRKFVFPAPDAKREEFERVFFSEHTDVGTVIPCRNNVLVKSIRELEREANFKPYEAPARFFVIDEADKMNDAASNALLKTLEEPATTSHIFLITSRPDRLLQTIRSRCQTLRFAPVPAYQITEFLIANKGMSEPDAEIVARLADGSLGRAASFDVARFRERRGAMLEILRSLRGDRPNLASLMNSSESMTDPKLKDEYTERLDWLRSLIHDVWTLSIGRDVAEIINIDIRGELFALAAEFDRRELARWLRETEELRGALVLNLNRKIATDALLLGMAARK